GIIFSLSTIFILIIMGLFINKLVMHHFETQDRMNFDSDTNVVEVAIKRLRSKVDSNFTPKLIQNIRGMGYVLEVEDE
ncbi:winged helix-turn-helix domain-containing protein, partial [Staphylococcus aureus]|uniref:winged helix-turn-helix domain-containing protein n=1 Tax=Staphylococcus aureus TaxID=1280 RepID=UPI001C52DFA3